MRIFGLAVVAAAGTAILGCSTGGVTAFASSHHHHSLGCGGGSGNGSNNLNNIGGGQNQILNGVNLLDNLFVPVLSPGSEAHQRVSTHGSRISHSRGAVDSGDTGVTDCG